MTPAQAAAAYLRIARTRHGRLVVRGTDEACTAMGFRAVDAVDDPRHTALATALHGEKLALLALARSADR